MPRALVLCFDGTGDSFDDDCTNVIRFVKALEKKRPDKQLYYYQPGIGTYIKTDSSWSSSRQWITRKIDEGLAWYLDVHIMGGYRFLMDNYQEGDKICLFGFSRGAYTARCLAGMLHKVGLLPKSNAEQVAFAYRKYLDDTPKGKEHAQAFKRTFASSVPIEFVGVWDTVASVGFTFRHLPFTDSNSIIKNFRHALALDEHRVQFMPNPWHRSPKSRSAKDDPDKSATAAQGWLPRTKHAVNVILRRKPVNAGGEDDMKNDTSEDWKYHGGQPTSVREVWFAGCHADVGGGSTPNNRTHALANPSLQWMVSEVLKYAPDVLFRLDAFTYDNAFLTSKETRDGEEVLCKVEQKDPVQDANANKNDMLVKKPVWLILEYIPTFQYYQNREGDWKWRFRWNNRRPRKIYDGKPLLHASVKLRRDYENKWRTKFVPEDGNDLEFEYVD